ncbi:glycosyltransferase [Ferrimonas pelagia]|uniref:Glycosyltransferase 2-like domain-containing protein n=1 Tax=Ferrimonas pelagia TaxID=1177826 RepID=A0ABP9F1I3_9GAMM
MLKASVIIPVYNDPLRLIRCVDAILATPPTDSFEILVIDNASDPAWQLPPRIFQLPQVKVLFEAEPSSYAARNCGLLAAQGEVLLFTDSDCIPQPGWLQSALDEFERSPQMDMVAGPIELFAALPLRPTSAELFDMACGLDQERAVRNSSAFTANFAMRHSVVRELGGFDGQATSGGDVAFTQRAVAAGFHLGFFPGMCVRHPARRDLSQYRRKIRRIVSGAYQLSHHEPRFAEMFAGSGWLRSTLRPLRTASQILRSERTRQLSVMARCRAIWVLLHNKGYMQWLRLNYRWGRQSEVYRS